MENVTRTCVESGKADAAEEFIEVLSSPTPKRTKPGCFRMRQKMPMKAGY
jgi:hypothetical protein